jgi:hypothetical protein
MTFFYDLNKRLASIQDKPVPQTLNERDMSRAAKGIEKYGKEGMQALAKAGRKGKDLDPIRAKYDKYDESVDESTGDYSAKKARAGKDIGKPGKQFAQIAKSAGERYGSKERGEKVAGAVLAKLRGKNEGVEEGLGDMAKKIGSGIRKVAHRAMDAVAPSDEALLKDLQKKTGMPQTGRKPGNYSPMHQDSQVSNFAGPGGMNEIKSKKMAKEEYGPLEEKNDGNLANNAKPYDKITRGDVIAGRLGKDAMGGKSKTSKEANIDEGWDDMIKDVERRRSEVKAGHKVQGAKGEIEKTATGIKHTRRYDTKTGETDTGDDTPAQGEKRGRGRPKGTGKSMGAKGPSGKSKLMTKEQELDEISLDKIGRGVGSVIGGIGKTAGAIAGIPKGVARAVKQGYQGSVKAVGGAEADEIEAAKALLTKAGFVVKPAPRAKLAEKDQPVSEKAVSKNQAVAARIARGVQKGEVKAEPGSASAEMAKMEPKELKKFAKTDTKGLPKKVKAKEEVEETTVAGNVAPAAASKGSKGGMQFGKGIYDSMNRELEQMIAESMNISMSMNNDMHGGPSKSLTVTATDEDAMMLGKLLKMAGVGGDSNTASCGSPAEQVDENQPDWPTDAEQSNDALQYSGGLNKPKTTVAGDGQTTVPVTAVQVREETEDLDEQEQVMAPESEELDEALRRIKEMAGIREAAKPDYIDLDKDGNKKEPMKKAAADAEKDKKVEESILAMTNLWKAYKG